MKKWIICLCCLLLTAVIAIFVILQNNNTRVDELNKELYESRTEISSLKEKAAEDEKRIQELDTWVGDLTAERDQLATDKGELEESIENMNRNLTSSQQKLQGVLYILTDGVQGNIESVLSPYMKIFRDVGLESPYFDAVSHVIEHKLMSAREEELFSVDEKATLGEMAEGLYIMKHLTGTRTDATNALLNTEKTWLSSQQPAEETPAEEEAPAEESEEVADASTEEPAAEEPAAEEPAAEEPAAEEPAAEEPAAEEPVAEEPAAEEPAAEEPAAEEPAAEEPAAEEPAAEEPAAEESAAEEPAAEEPAAEESAAEEPAAEEPAAEEPAAEEPAAETAPAEEVADDESTVLTRERLLALCKAVCYENGWAEPEIALPESGETEANRGDLAIVLAMLDQIEK